MRIVYYSSVNSVKLARVKFGTVAQLAERQTVNLDVVGSSPTGPAQVATSLKHFGDLKW